MYSLNGKITMSEMSVALLAMIVLSLLESRAIIVTFTIAIMVAVGVVIDLISINQLINGIIIYLLLCLITLGALYSMHWHFIRKSLQKLPSRKVGYLFMEDGCSISSASWSGFVSWMAISRAFRCPSVWLLELKRTQSRKELVESLLSALRQNTSITAWGKSVQPIEFPVVWLRPIPLRTFLLVPTKDCDKKLLRLIYELINEHTNDRTAVRRIVGRIVGRNRLRVPTETRKVDYGCMADELYGRMADKL